MWIVTLLAFEEGYVERMWGGDKLRRIYHKATPGGARIGEAWMIADHPQHVSVVADGPHKGQTLRQLLEDDPARILGTRAQLTVHGRFPLLLKLLDAGDKLSIQVHPDDEAALRWGESDVGKREMWYVLQSDEDSMLYCGMRPETTREEFEAALIAGSLADLLIRFPAREGTAVFVDAGTVHAIGGGSLLAEIQQNSDLTYRVDDWGRVQPDGTPRDLDLEKAMDVTQFGSKHTGAARPAAYTSGAARISVLAACRHFAAERIDLAGRYHCDTRGESFVLLLGISGDCTVKSQGTAHDLKPGSALMVAGSATDFNVEGTASFLRYYVPDLEADIRRPLSAAGHLEDTIVRLGGDPDTSDLAR